MLERLFRKRKPRVFLGAIGVSDRTDLKRHLENEGNAEDEPLGSALRQSLTEIFSLPSADTVEEPQSSDLVLDIWIPKYQSGEMLHGYFFDASIVLFWRPKITVSARLSSLLTKQSKRTFLVTEKMRWKQFLGRILWAIGGAQPIVRQDMDRLLCQACVTLLTKIQKSL